MTKTLALATAALIAAPAVAADGSAGDAGPTHNLRVALHQMIQSDGHSPPGQGTRPVDPDMGDDNASDRAIFEVCTKDRPAAQRSAICRSEPISPD